MPSISSNETIADSAARLLRIWTINSAEGKPTFEVAVRYYRTVEIMMCDTGKTYDECLKEIHRVYDSKYLGKEKQ